jgi:hypothetical protein
MGFAFTAMTDRTAAVNAKQQMLEDFLTWFKIHCPNLHSTLLDKDTLEINAFQTVLDKAKHQLCYWHAI